MTELICINECSYCKISINKKYKGSDTGKSGIVGIIDDNGRYNELVKQFYFKTLSELRDAKLSSIL